MVTPNVGAARNFGNIQAAAVGATAAIGGMIPTAIGLSLIMGQLNAGMSSNSTISQQSTAATYRQRIAMYELQQAIHQFLLPGIEAGSEKLAEYIEYLNRTIDGETRLAEIIQSTRQTLIDQRDDVDNLRDLFDITNPPDIDIDRLRNPQQWLRPPTDDLPDWLQPPDIGNPLDPLRRGSLQSPAIPFTGGKVVNIRIDSITVDDPEELTRRIRTLSNTGLLDD